MNWLRRMVKWLDGPAVQKPRRLSSRWIWSRTARACAMVPMIYLILVVDAFTWKWLGITTMKGQMWTTLIEGAIGAVIIVPYSCDLWGPQHVNNLESKPAPTAAEPPPAEAPGPLSRPSGLAER